MIKFHIIESGYFMADGGAMFGPIPKIYWERKYPCNNQNLCVMSMRCLLLESANNLILIDTGIGNKHDLKFYQPFDMKDIVEEIAKIGYQPDELTDVVLSHLHFDHCGYSTMRDNKENIVPTFPNARYWLSKAQWENYKNPRLFEEDSFFAENIEPVYQMNQLHLIEKETKLLDGVTLKLFDGHTPGQIVVFINNDNEKIVFPGDVIPTSAHVSLGWLSAYDNNVALAMEEKKRLLEIISDEGYRAIFYHDSQVASSEIIKKNGYYFTLKPILAKK